MGVKEVRENISPLDAIDWNPQRAWRHFRLEVVAAQNYPLSYLGYGSNVRRDLILEMILPTLLYIKAAALLDDSLVVWLSRNNHVLSGKYHNTLGGRIKYCVGKDILPSTTELHGLPPRRNELAHGSDARCDWAELYEAVNLIEMSLISLGLISATSKLEYFVDCSPKESKDTTVAFSYEHRYGVKENGKAALEVSWTENIFKE